MYTATRYAAAFHDWPGEVVDVTEISERNKNKPKELFHIFEAEGRRHRMVRAAEGKKKFHCKMYGLRSFNDKVPGACSGPK